MESTSAVVAWQTHLPEASALTFWTGDTAAQVRLADSTVALDHAVALTALRPDTEYGYRVRTWTGRFTEPAAFRTPPLPGARRPFRFLVFGDSGEGTEGQLRVADRMAAEEDVALAIHVGDVAYDNGSEVDFDFRHFAVYKELLDGAPFYPSLGNHDIRTELGAPYLNAFHLPQNGPRGDERTYSFQRDNVLFVALDSNAGPTYTQRFGDLRDPEGEQASWLEAELRRARGNPTVDWIVVYMHHAPFSSGTGIGGHGSDVALQQTLVPIFDRYRVDLVFTGHDHHYERTFPIRCRPGAPVTAACRVRAAGGETGAEGPVARGSGTVYIVSGAGGGPLAWRAVGVSWWTAFARQVYQYVSVDVEPQALAVRAKDADGNVIDEVRIEGPRAEAAPAPAEGGVLLPGEEPRETPAPRVGLPGETPAGGEPR